MFYKILLMVGPITVIIIGLLIFKHFSGKKTTKVDVNTSSGKYEKYTSLDYSKYTMSPKEYIKYFSISGGAIFLATYIFYSSFVLSSISFVIVLILLKQYKEYLIHKRKNILNAQFKDLLYSISSYINAGKDMSFALEKSLESLRDIYNEKDHIVREVNYLVKRINGTNDTPEKVFKEFAVRSDIQDIYDFADVYEICRNTGGDLNKVINKTSRLIIEKINVRKEISMVTSQKKYEAKLLTIMPFFMIGFINMFSVGYLDYLYTTFGGRIIMTLGLLAIGFAYYWGSKITDIEV